VSRNRYIIISRNPSVPDQNALTGFLKGKSWGYWHWMNNCWLVTTKEALTVFEMRDFVRSVAPKMHFLAFELKDDKKAGFGPSKWWEWFNRSWKD
jgi:hypothetical protein